MSVPSALSCTAPINNLLTNFSTNLYFLANYVLFVFIFAPILLFIAFFVMFVYGLVIYKRLKTSNELMKRMMAMPKYFNPFFDDNNAFLGYKDEVRNINMTLFKCFPVPTFEISKDEKIVDENEVAEEVFGNIRGELIQNVPNEMTDVRGVKHHYNYETFHKKILPDDLITKGEKVTISNDVTGLYNKKETLKDLYKDIRLTFSIPTVLQREKASHIQNVAIVNFSFANSVSNSQFLEFSSKLEDLFSQFVSFFMFEKMRFSFYVLFYDANSPRQAARDAVNFAQLARFESQQKEMNIKIAVSMEEEIIAEAEKTDMIWSVKFPNSILWRTDVMMSYIDYGRIICLSKMSPGVHFTKSIRLGICQEKIECVTL